MAPGMSEMLLIGIVVILLFGPKRIPELARSMGKFMGEFTQAQREVELGLSNLNTKNSQNPLDSSNPPQPQRENIKIRQMAENLDIDVEGKSDDQLLDEIQATLETRKAAAKD
ncbi:MAG: twin-arginine translocase TatA/TatE family subunit [Halobacteriota archaeon]|nr:twin-arginine translocase TatA/TatE family subunit [Halobacteriota archaeon]